MKLQKVNADRSTVPASDENGKELNQGLYCRRCPQKGKKVENGKKCGKKGFQSSIFSKLRAAVFPETPAMRPKTTHSRSEFPASRFEP